MRSLANFTSTSTIIMGQGLNLKPAARSIKTIWVIHSSNNATSEKPQIIDFDPVLAFTLCWASSSFFCKIWSDSDILIILYRFDSDLYINFSIIIIFRNKFKFFFH